MNSGTPIRSRLAPTPSGFLHIGNAYNFLLAEQIVRSRGGLLRLRIDDGDAPRVRPEYLTDIFDSLDWLGIRPDDGPRDPGEHIAGYSQTLRRALYDQYIQALAEGGHLFACTCSRSEIAAATADGGYPGTCRDKGLSLDTRGASIRLRTPQTAFITFDDRLMGPVTINLDREMRDVVIRRKDRIPAYAISSLADDVHYGITAIVRGRDLLPATAVQMYIASLLPFAATFLQAAFFHHPLLAENGQKLSKSAGASGLRTARATGISPDRIREDFSAWLTASGIAL